jgi:hypothetical protein
VQASPAPEHPGEGLLPAHHHHKYSVRKKNLMMLKISGPQVVRAGTGVAQPLSPCCGLSLGPQGPRGYGELSLPTSSGGPLPSHVSTEPGLR